MAQEKPTSPTSWPLGFTGWDIVWLSLVAVLIIGLIPTRWWVVQRTMEPTPTPIPSLVSTTPAAALTNPKETPMPTPTNTPTEEPTATPTETLISTPTNVPTDTPTPVVATLTATASIAAPTNEPTTSTPPTATATATVTPTPTDTPPPTSSADIPLPTLIPSTIVYVSNKENHPLRIVNSSGTTINDNLQRYAAAPAWSPDGKRIAFFGVPGIEGMGGIYSQGEGIWTVNSQGEDPKQLNKYNNVKNLAWSPDGAKLAFEYEHSNGTRKVAVADTGIFDPNPPELDGEQPAWNPINNGQLAIRLSNSGLWLVNSDGSRIGQITSDRTDSFPAWSPDGQYLAFASQERHDNWEIYRLRIIDNKPQGEPERLTNRPETDTTPVFSPDGQEIYLLTDAGGIWQIIAIPSSHLNNNGTDKRDIVRDVWVPIEWGWARPSVRK